jgi:hypothetical protein
MKYLVSLLMAFILLLPMAGLTAQPAAASTIPTFSILSVARDQTVTIRTYNFPANDTFQVRMGAMGTRGVGGTLVDTIGSGSGGSFDKTFAIPDALKGSYQIAIRLESPYSGYFAYNWFYNNTSGSSGTPAPTAVPGTGGYSGFPTFSILSVARDVSVTIRTANLPPNDSFNVRMNVMHTKGVGGTLVSTVSSGSGGTKEFTFSIPDWLKGSYQIAIRMESPSSGYFAYNWFYNNTVGASGTPAPTAVPGTGGYSGFPTFSIFSVVRDQTVTIHTNNLPPNDTFTVRMAVRGNRGIGGTVVSTIPSGAGGSQEFTFNIPAGLKGTSQIAIRLESSSSGYFAYNWFYNSTYP